MSEHPNTTAAAVYGGVGTLTVWLLNKYTGAHFNAVAAASIATGLASARLFVGRRGIKGAWDAIWNGTTKPAPKK